MSEARSRRPNQQTLSWYWDLYNRRLLDLDPPYQRRSVWSDRFKEEFVETLLLDFPCPSIFLHSDTREDGATRYAVVDGKQRLTAAFEFADGEFSVGESKILPSDIVGRYFGDLPSDLKKRFWDYELTTEYVTSDLVALDDIFDRLNRNVAKLTRQELRHARFSGEFASAVETLSEELVDTLGIDFPRIAASSRRQMKDTELVATLLMLIQWGPEEPSDPNSVDEQYAEFDSEWPERRATTNAYRKVIKHLLKLRDSDLGLLANATRLRNQGDFYSLFAAVHEAQESGLRLADPDTAVQRLIEFIRRVSDEETRKIDEDAAAYYAAARSAANDPSRRRTRIDLLKRAVTSDER